MLKTFGNRSTLHDKHIYVTRTYVYRIVRHDASCRKVGTQKNWLNGMRVSLNISVVQEGSVLPQQYYLRECNLDPPQQLLLIVTPKLRKILRKRSGMLTMTWSFLHDKRLCWRTLGKTGRMEWETWATRYGIAATWFPVTSVGIRSVFQKDGFRLTSKCKVRE